MLVELDANAAAHTMLCTILVPQPSYAVCCRERPRCCRMIRAADSLSHDPLQLAAANARAKRSLAKRSLGPSLRLYHKSYLDAAFVLEPKPLSVRCAIFAGDDARSPPCTVCCPVRLQDRLNLGHSVSMRLIVPLDASSAPMKTQAPARVSLRKAL